jgi:hypothetical protein
MHDLHDYTDMDATLSITWYVRPVPFETRGGRPVRKLPSKQPAFSSPSQTSQVLQYAQDNVNGYIFVSHKPNYVW